MRTWVPVAVTGLLTGPAAAADMTVKVEIPTLSVAEYHKPYVAVWVERPDQGFVGNLAVWYDLKMRNNEGTKWLKDLRQWWRRSGRSLEMPVDGVSGATRAPGLHEVDTKALPIASLPPGEYSLVVEAAREVGGRELLRVPFQWPPAKPVAETVKGEHELGAVTIDLKP